MKKTIMIALIILLLAVFIFSSWKIVDALLEYRKGVQTYEALAQYVAFPETTPTAAQTPTSPIEEVQMNIEESTAESIFPSVDFRALQALNEDVIGWIYIPDTQVNYPVLQGDDNDDYLYHLLTGEYNSSGSIFLDAEVAGDFSSPNSPIYGHNMKNGTMFKDITGYKKQEFFDAHPTALLLTPEKNYFVHLFSGYVTDSWGDAWDKEFTDSEFEEWLQAAKEKSRFTSDVVPTIQDKILTFSTCTYDTHDARFIVHGVLEEYIG